MIVYVDFENVRDRGLNGIQYLNENDTLYIFFSCQAPKIKKEFWNIANDLNLRVKTRKLYKTVKNGLDFYIASQLGADTILYPDEEFAIISGDGDFEGIQDYWARVAPVRHRVYISPDIKESLKNCTDSRGSYVRATEVLLPVESMEHSPVTENPEDNLKDLLSMVEEKGLRFTYNYCLKTYKKDGVAVYRQLKSLLEKDSTEKVEFQPPQVILMEETETVAPKEPEENKEEPEEIETPAEEIIRKAQDFSMYGTIESMAIAERILSLKNGSPISEVSGYLTRTAGFEKKPSFGEYYASFAGVKVSDITMDIKRLAGSGAYSVKNDTIDDIDENLLKQFASPDPIRYLDPGCSFAEYRDVDWIYLMNSGEILSANNWKDIMSMFDRLYFIVAKKNEIATFLRRAPKEVINKVKKLKGKSSNGKKATLDYILKHIN